MFNSKFFITAESIAQYIENLKNNEHAEATIEKYEHDIRAFAHYLNDSEATKQAAIEWRKELQETHAATSVNAAISAVNGYFEFFDLGIKMKFLKIQKNTFIPKEKILTQKDYERLIHAARAKNDEQLVCIMQTLGSTGIRVSELKFITVESVLDGKAEVTNKNKTRMVFICEDLKKLLLDYAKKKGIASGAIFITRNGKPLDRSNIWRKIQNLSDTAKVKKSKLFPHNFRKMFAKSFYGKSKDLAKLSDLLGHGNINTTKIYIMETGDEHLKIIESLKLVI